MNLYEILIIIFFSFFQQNVIFISSIDKNRYEVFIFFIISTIVTFFADILLFEFYKPLKEKFFKNKEKMLKTFVNKYSFLGFFYKFIPFVRIVALWILAEKKNKYSYYIIGVNSILWSFFWIILVGYLNFLKLASLVLFIKKTINIWFYKLF